MAVVSLVVRVLRRRRRRRRGRSRTGSRLPRIFIAVSFVVGLSGRSAAHEEQRLQSNIHPQSVNGDVQFARADRRPFFSPIRESERERGTCTPLTTSSTGASGCARLYASTSPVSTSAPADALCARTVLACEPSGFTHKAGASRINIVGQALFSFRVERCTTTT